MGKQKKQFQSSELFEKILLEIEINYPVVLKYDDGGFEAFFENGVRFFIKIIDGNICYTKSKFIQYNGDSSKGAREQYEWNIRRLLHTHQAGTIEDFNNIVDNFSKENEKLDDLAFEHAFMVEQEENTNGVIKRKNQIIKDEPKQPEEDHPF